MFARRFAWPSPCCTCDPKAEWRSGIGEAGRLSGQTRSSKLKIGDGLFLRVLAATSDRILPLIIFRANAYAGVSMRLLTARNGNACLVHKYVQVKSAVQKAIVQFHGPQRHTRRSIECRTTLGNHAPGTYKQSLGNPQCYTRTKKCRPPFHASEHQSARSD